MQSTKVNPILCKGAQIYEQFLGKFSDKNFTVSKAFKKDLSERFGIQNDTISVLYDRAVKGKFNLLTID